MCQVSCQAAIDVSNTDQIFDVIRQVASRTNLLELNAEIEAARAEEHERGFAGVAEDVRKMSILSSDLIKNICGMLEQMKQSRELVNRSTQQTATIKQEQSRAIPKITEMLNELHQVG